MDVRTLLKALLPSFLPLIAFVAVEAFFGEVVGLAAGLVIGGIEFFYVLAKEGRVDPFVLADTAFLGVAGLLSLALHNEIFFKLKPVIIETVMAGVLGLALLAPPEFLRRYMESQVKGIRIGDAALPGMKKNLAIMLCVLVAHVLLSIAAVLFWSNAVWAFVTGGLLYILFALAAIGQFAASRIAARKSGAGIAGGASLLANTGEILPLVDEEGAIVGRMTRVACHQGPGHLHPVVRLHILDGRGGIYLQKRSMSVDAAPGKWDAAAAGHVSWGESLEQSLGRELREELGITTMAIEAAGGKIEPAFRYRADSASESELVHVFVTIYSGELFPDGVEAETVRLWPIPEVIAAIGEGMFSPALERDIGLMSTASSQPDGAAERTAVRSGPGGRKIGPAP